MRLLFLSNTRNNENKAVVGLLKTWIKPDGKIAYFSASPDPTRKYFSEICEWFKKIIDRENLYYLDANSTLDEINNLSTADAIFLSGGNTYHLLKALRDTGADQLIRKAKAPIIGVSAGGLCLTPDVGSASAENDIGLTDSRGLGLVDFGFYPHYTHNEICMTEINEFMKSTKIKEVIALPEYSGLAAVNKTIIQLGEVVRFPQ